MELLSIMQETKIETFCPASRQEWRQWLQENHHIKQSVWLVQHKKKTNMASISWSDAVDEALCFGWIDSIRKSRDNDSYIQFFSKRKARGTWSKINKEKIKLLIEQGLMTQAGFDSIERAKQNGSWTILDEVEELLIPIDLDREFETKPGSKDFFLSLSKSVRKFMLAWIVLAKLPETRQKRIREIAELASQKLKPKQF
ncbi:MAG: YdeI/OmpD-associated family protein [Bacteroidia bacterium]